MKAFCISLCLLCIFWMTSTQKSGCRESQLDNRMKPLVSLTREVKWPENEQAITQMCNAMPKAIAQSRDYMKKCANGETKTILSVSIHAVEKTLVKLYCRNKSEKNKMVGSSKCANNGRDRAAKCWSDMVSSMTAIANTTVSKDRIPMLCCSLIRWKDCFIKSYEEIGPPVCTKNNVEFLDQYLYKSTIEPLNIFCSDIEETDKCSAFEQFFVQSVQKRTKFGTPFPGIIRIFENL